MSVIALGSKWAWCRDVPLHYTMRPKTLSLSVDDRFRFLLLCSHYLLSWQLGRGKLLGQHNYGNPVPRFVQTDGAVFSPQQVPTNFAGSDQNMVDAGLREVTIVTAKEAGIPAPIASGEVILRKHF